MIKLRHLLCAIAFFPGWLWAQNCIDNVNATTPGDRFTINGDGTVTDSRTGLHWQRCSMGYALDDKGTAVTGDDVCELQETATFDWQSALQSAEDLNNSGGSAGFTDWRVPNVKELVSIVEYQCFYPAINLAIFPDTVAGKFWSSTPHQLTTAAIVDFQFGQSSFDFMSIFGTAHNVRLVRGGN